MDLLHGVVDVAIGQAGETDLTVRIVAAEISEPIVVDAAEMSAGTSDDPFAPIPDLRALALARFPAAEL
jgi:hypothetical protein